MGPRRQLCSLQRGLVALFGVYFYGTLAVNRGNLLGLRTCNTFASLASVARLFELKDQVLTLVFQAWARATIFALVTTTLSPQHGGQVDLQVSPWKSLPTSAQQQQAAAANEKSSSLSTQGGHSSFQATVVSLEGKTVMILAHSWGLVAELHDAVGVVLGLPTSCFYLSIGCKILQNDCTLDEAGVNMGSVVRAS